MPTQPKNTAIQKSVRVPMRGDLGITVRDAKTGLTIRRIEIRNTITYVALGYLVDLISQNAGVRPAAYKIAQLAVGQGTTSPTRADAALVSPVATIALVDANRVPTTNGPYELKILATLGSTVGNGFTLAEAGLFTAGAPIDGALPAILPALFARQIHPGIPKTIALVVDYDWRIAFTA